MKQFMFADFPPDLIEPQPPGTSSGGWLLFRMLIQLIRESLSWNLSYNFHDIFIILFQPWLWAFSHSSISSSSDL